jgi:hypothetical protein
MEHTCRLCGATKPDSEFYVSDKARCKECVKAAVRDNRNRRAEQYREYDRKRFQEDPRVRERHKRYQSTEAGKASLRAARAKYPSWKKAATTILNNAVRDGKIEKPQFCSACGKEHHRIHGHHEDYTKPLDVIWLCPKCHRDRHYPSIPKPNQQREE